MATMVPVGWFSYCRILSSSRSMTGGTLPRAWPPTNWWHAGTLGLSIVQRDVWESDSPILTMA